MTTARLRGPELRLRRRLELAGKPPGAPAVGSTGSRRLAP